ncbi:ATP-dependent Clp protease proteolytic subunit [bacterium]|nr:ATP-dependent Clp protease proteolytic subunit [bacterium]
MKLIFAKKSKDIATFHIHGIVGQEVNGNWIAEDINNINQYWSEDIKEIHVRINSEGGNVINGMSAVSAILNSKVPVKTFNDGYAMSMSAIIWLSAKKKYRYAAEFALLMLHAPYLANDDGSMADIEDENERALVEAVGNQLKTIIKSTTGKSDVEVNEIFSKDTFYNVDEMLTNGFVDPENIIRFQNKLKLGKDIASNINRIAAFYNSNNNNKKMDIKDFFDSLNLFNKATEGKKTVENYGEMKIKYDAVVEDKKTLTARAEKAEARIVEFKTELKGLENLKAELAKKAATDKVEKLITDGKIKAETKDAMIETATKTPEVFDSIVEALTAEVKAPALPEILGDINAVAKEFDIEGELNVHNAYKVGKLEAIKAKYPGVYSEMMKKEGAE